MTSSEVTQLPSEDLRGVFGVLETAAASAGNPDFFEELRESIARNIGWRDCLLVDIPPATLPFPPADRLLELVYTGRPRDFVVEYAERWYGDNPLKSSRAVNRLRANGVVELEELVPHGGHHRVPFVQSYLLDNGIDDLFEGLVDGGAAGAALLCVYFSDRAHASTRERCLLGTLCRHLSSWLVTHRASARWRRLESLTRREREVFDLVAAGLTNREVASRLFITVDTVKKHLANGMAKTGARNRTELVTMR